MLKILIADDEIIERRYLTSLFEKHRLEYDVIGEARNGKEIIDLASRLNPDIIIMDINMPLINGLDSAYAIKERFPDTIILLNTAYAEFEFARKAIEYRLDAYLLKPAKEEQILETIQKCVKQRSYRSTGISKYTDELVQKAGSSSNNAVDQVIDYINEHCQTTLSLEELAELVHFSPSYLSKIFHQTMGITLKSYITLKRIENAQYLLVSSDLSIQEISSNCGFSNTSHFNRVFKQQTGMSPLEFRHHHS